MKKNCLEEEMEFHSKHPDIAMSYCQVDRIDENDEVISYPDKDEGTPDVVSSELATQLSFYYGSITGNISNVMLKKQILNEVELFREDMKVSGDYEMWVRISGRYPIGCIHKSLMKLCVHDDQFSRQKGIYPLFMKEDNEVKEKLLRRLPYEIKSFAMKYHRWHHNTQHFHYLLKNIICGDMESAKNSYFQLKKIDNVFILFLIWILTFNNRYLILKPKFAYKKNNK